MARMSMHRRSRPLAPGIAALLLVLAAALVSAPHAQDVWVKNELRNSPPSLFLQQWSARDDAGRDPLTIFFLEISPLDFVFTSDDGQFVARFAVDVSIYDDHDDLLERRQLVDSIRVEGYAATVSADWNRLYRIALPLPVGEHRMVTRLVDRNVDKEAVYRSYVAVAPPLGPLGASDILMARRDEILGADGDRDAGVMPFPAAVYGADLSDLFCYFELYNPDRHPGDSLTYRLTYIDPEGVQTVIRERAMRCPVSRQPVLNSLDTGNLPPGAYRLLLEVRPHGGIYRLERDQAFFVYQNPLDLRFADFDEMVTVLRLIGEDSEIDALAAVPPDDRQGALLDFWARRNPAGDGPDPDMVGEFYHRVAVARRQYNPDSDAAELSDRGKIYVMLGKPDAVEQQEPDTFGPQLEIWHYRDRNLQLVFQDDFGVGRFRLVTPPHLLTNLF